MRRLFPLIVLCLLALGMLAGLTYGNYRFAVDNPGGIDFLTHWVAARAVAHGVSPYAPEVAQEVQQRFYGRTALPGENEFLVEYPIYYTALILPFAPIDDYPFARAAWMTFAEVLLALLAILSLWAVDWKPSIGLAVGLVLFSLFWYQGFRAVINGNLVVLVAAALVLVALAVRKKMDILAGLALVAVTIKPNVGLLPVVWVLIWAVSARRTKIWLSFLVFISAFSIIGWLLFPGWPFELLANLSRYTAYNPPTNPGMVFDLWLPGWGAAIGRIFSILVAGLCLYAWLKAGRRAEVDPFLWGYCLVIAATPWSGITTDPGNFLTLFLPLALVLKRLHRTFPPGWTAGALLALFLGLWALFFVTLEADPSGQAVQSPILFFPLPLLVMAGLLLLQDQFPARNEQANPTSGPRGPVAGK
jgi:hypothetical protein